MSGSPIVQTWVQLLLAASWQVVVLALLVWLCERMHWLRSPRVRHSLWWFVLLAPLALAPTRLLLSQRHAMVHLPAPAAVTMMAKAVTVPPLLPVTAPAAPVASEPVPAPARPFPWRAAILVGWLLGCAVMALRLVVGHWRVRRMHAESTPVEAGAVRALLDEMCAQSGVRAALRQSATLGAAMLCGVRKPTVIIPRDWLSELAPGELRALLAHEVAHLRRRDLLTMLAQRVIEIPLFFHPAVWAVGRCLAAAREELCDAWAVAQGADPAEYARCLTRVAVRAQARFALASVGLAEGKSRLRQRVEAILGSRSRGTVSRRVAVAMAAVLLVCVAGFAAVTVTASESQPAPAGESAQAAIVDFTVLLADGQPAVEAGVVVEPTGRIGAAVPTDAQGKARVIVTKPGAETRFLVFHNDPDQQSRVTLHLRRGTHTRYTVRLKAATACASLPAPEGDRATLDLTVLFRNGEPVPGAAVTLEVRTKAFQVFVKADQPGQLVRASRPGSRRLWELYWALGKTDRQGKATVTVAYPGPGTRLLTVTYHDPRLDQDVTAKRLLALQPGTRTSATITIPSGAVQTIRSAPSTAGQAAARRRGAGS